MIENMNLAAGILQKEALAITRFISQDRNWESNTCAFDCYDRAEAAVRWLERVIAPEEGKTEAQASYALTTANTYLNRAKQLVRLVEAQRAQVIPTRFDAVPF